MAGCGGGIGKRLSHLSPDNIRDNSRVIRDGPKDICDSPENIRDNSRDIRDGPEDPSDGLKNIHDSPKDIRDCSPENPRQLEEERVEAQPPSRPLPAL